PRRRQSGSLAPGSDSPNAGPPPAVRRPRRKQRHAFFYKRPEGVHLDLRQMQVANKRLGELLGMIARAPQPLADGFVLVAGDFFGCREAAPTHHDQQRAGDFFGRRVQTKKRRTKGGAEGMAAAQTTIPLLAVFMAVLDDVPVRAVRAGRVIFTR